MNQPLPPSSMKQQTIVPLQQSCQSLSNQNRPSPLHFSNAKKRRRRGNVHFASTSDLCTIPFKSSRDKKSTWYTEQDFTNFKCDLRSCSVLMAKSSCTDSLESIAYFLATKTATSTMKHHLHPNEKMLTRGIEHTVSPTVLKLIVHRRKVVIRKVLHKQARMREKPGINKQELELRMIVELAQCSMDASLFAKDWAALKLLHD